MREQEEVKDHQLPGFRLVPDVLNSSKTQNLLLLLLGSSCHERLSRTWFDSTNEASTTATRVDLLSNFNASDCSGFRRSSRFTASSRELTLRVGGARVRQGRPELGARPLGVGVMGPAVACGGVVRVKDQKGGCEEEEQVGGHQCPQDVLAALLSTGPDTGRVPAEGGGRGRGRGRGSGGAAV